MSQHWKSRFIPDLLEEIPRFTATIWLVGGEHRSPVIQWNSRRESSSSSEGHRQRHYTHDYPPDPGNSGLAACGTAVIQVMDLQHSLLKYQTQQFFTAFTLEFMAQGGDLRTRRGIIALFSSRAGKLMVFCQSLFGKVTCRHGPRAGRGCVWQGLPEGHTHVTVTRVLGHVCEVQPPGAPRNGKAAPGQPNPLREHLLLVFQPRFLVSQPFRLMWGQSRQDLPPKPANSRAAARELQGWVEALLPKGCGTRTEPWFLGQHLQPSSTRHGSTWWNPTPEDKMGQNRVSPPHHILEGPRCLV